MPKYNQGGDPPFPDYAPVADRITLFYERYPNGRILTRLHSRSDREVTFLALVYRDSGDAKPAATGWASEREGDGEINEVACLENTETSAIGRALANLGFTASSRRPSREEMEKAVRERARLARRPTLVSEPFVSRSVLDADPLQRGANLVHDALDLLERADAIGFPAQRAEALREVLLRGQLSPRRVTRLERRIRVWIARHRSTMA
jgi:hypothetical protein